MRRIDPVWSAQRLAETVPFAAWSAGTASARRLLRLLAGLDLLPAAILAPPARVAQQPTLTPETTLATLLGYASVFAALSRFEQGQGLADDFDLLDGHRDLTDRLSLAFREADLPPFSADRPAFTQRRRADEGSAVRRLRCLGRRLSAAG